MSTIPLFVWPLGPVINTEPVRYVVNKVDHDRVVDTLREQNRVLRSNLVNCAARLEAYYGEDYPAVRDAKAALTATSQPAKPAGKMHACDIPGCVSCGNPEDATSQEGQAKDLRCGIFGPINERGAT